VIEDGFKVVKMNAKMNQTSALACKKGEKKLFQWGNSNISETSESSIQTIDTSHLIKKPVLQLAIGENHGLLLTGATEKQTKVPVFDKDVTYFNKEI
jgi:hypothetical protein